MSRNSIHSIVLIGAGNVATHLAEAFQHTGRRILQVYSRSEESAKLLADKIDVPYTCNLKQLIPDADLYIIAVADAAIPQLASDINIEDGLVVHTSGFHGLDAIRETSRRTGVFYPLQTFSKNKTVDFLSIPVCVEATTEEDVKLLEDLALSFSSDVRLINSQQRKSIHLAAVFACNFTNYMYQIAGDLLNESGVAFDILKPLITETASKVITLNPEEAQTGPARRNDQVVMQQHLDMLKDEDYKALYEKISAMMIEKFHKK